jgi:16S rRNA (cytidine1402-2'-O)-methyltransferase
LELEKLSEKYGQTQIFIETPFRNNQLMDDILKTCRPDTLLSVSCDLTSANELIKSKNISGWRTDKPDLHKRPAIFLLYRR